MSGWKTVQKGVTIEFDLENTPLEIKTGSAINAQSYHSFIVEFFTAEEKKAGVVLFHNYSAPQYQLWQCNPLSNFTTNIPTNINKIWKITLNRTSSLNLMIHCNEVEVLNLVVSASTCSDTSWGELWTRYPVSKINFYRPFSASDSYRAAPGKLYRDYSGKNTEAKSCYFVSVTVAVTHSSGQWTVV